MLDALEKRKFFRALRAAATYDGPIVVHGAVETLNAAYRAEGVALPPTTLVTEVPDRRLLAGALVVIWNPQGLSLSRGLWFVAGAAAAFVRRHFAAVIVLYAIGALVFATATVAYGALEIYGGSQVGGSQVAISRGDGTYRLLLPHGTYDLQASGIGFAGAAHGAAVRAARWRPAQSDALRIPGVVAQGSCTQAACG